ncbi:RNA polymerase II subunit A C-terminal domain phosphatase-like [Xenia sp. Carnegie-2017]|uniref:RNA polymerase II subunit A C-terminal domain phosphatase-like n=1 Tax=Xenia sp. Carnegie-2017 TaxID=2897299 RepID=UPI001F045A9F|nr:RNA polymerase II subunit A C-terminal domain phosphatase-like [Xenia sp. Carnegie-2017]
MAEYLKSDGYNEMILSQFVPCQLVKWKVFPGQKVSKGSILALYKKLSSSVSSVKSEIILLPKLKCLSGGCVKKLLVAEGDLVKPGQVVLLMNNCEHKIVMKDMCAECGEDLRQENGIPGDLKEPVTASVPLVHNIPELRVSQKEAEIIATKDKESLLRNGKLVLIVDLDQTLIHTTTENVPSSIEDIYHFQLYGQSCWYHTKFRPGWRKFLENVSRYFELHIFTMGSRLYAHTIARLLDPSGVFFADRIRSRDESFDMCSKYRDLRALFPCDDSMVCIIDDREDIWNSAPNLIAVKPYRYFSGTGDINAPVGSEQSITHISALAIHQNEREFNENCTEDSTDGVLETCGEREDRKDNIEVDKSDLGTHLSGEDESKMNVGNRSKINEDKRINERMEEMNEEDRTKLSEEAKTKPSEEDGGKMNEEDVSQMRDGYDNEVETSTFKDEGKLKEYEDKRKEDAVEEYSENDKPGNVSRIFENSQPDVVDGHHVQDHDDYLLYLEEILCRIHSTFYKIVEKNKRIDELQNRNEAVCGEVTTPDLRCIVPRLRQNVLKGANIVFTGVIPTHTRPEESQPWRIARQFGANVSRDLLTHKNTAEPSERTSHVIAARPGTEKACIAQRMRNVRLVNPNWLWTCVERWEWVEERLFPVESKSDHSCNTIDVSRRNTVIVQSEKESYTERDEKLEEITKENMNIVFNPFLSFSSGDMAAMDQEVEDLMRSSDEEDETEKLSTLESLSSSSEDADVCLNSSKISRTFEDDGVDKEMNFATIKQNENNSPPTKRKKLDFNDGESDTDEGDFGADEDSSESNSGDDDGMAALLEAELFH